LIPAIRVIFIGWAGITFPFVGNETTGRSVAYRLIMGAPLSGPDGNLQGPGRQGPERGRRPEGEDRPKRD